MSAWLDSATGLVVAFLFYVVTYSLLSYHISQDNNICSSIDYENEQKYNQS